MNRNLIKAAQILKGGGIIIFPTDTAFGIGCRIDNEKTVRRLFELRKRSKEKAVPILVSSISMAEEYIGSLPPEIRKLTKKYWPGGLTLVFKCSDARVPDIVRGGGETIGVRMPGHRTVRQLIKKLGVPILGPSANFSNQQTPYNMRDFDPKLVKSVDFVMPGRCKIKKPSTVVDVSKKPWRILRQGAVKIEL